MPWSVWSLHPGCLGSSEQDWLWREVLPSQNRYGWLRIGVPVWELCPRWLRRKHGPRDVIHKGRSMLQVPQWFRDMLPHQIVQMRVSTSVGHELAYRHALLMKYSLAYV